MTQHYDDYYWNLTLGLTDYTGVSFNEYLLKIVEFIDTYNEQIHSDVKTAYKSLQAQLIDDYEIDEVSIRKNINGFVKLGFINTGLQGYHIETMSFLSEQDPEKKMTLFSKIVYSNSSFNRSVTKESDVREINFFVKTLSENGGSLTKEQAQALMTIDIQKLDTDYAQSNDIEYAVQHVRQTDFQTRKYNQMSYLWNLIGKLDDLVVSGESVYLASDPRLDTLSVSVDERKGRDAYAQRLYKRLLIEESGRYHGAILCMVEHLDYPGLIASHIKPYRDCTEAEQFDQNNGLLLSRTIDFLFDQGFISFEDDGTAIVSDRTDLSEELKTVMREKCLDPLVLNDKRKVYLAHHREFVLQ